MRAGSQWNLERRRTADDRSAAEATSAFRAHWNDVYRYLLRKTHDPWRAEDLAQEVFLEASARLEHVDCRSRPVLQWLYAVAHRRFVDDVRRGDDRRRRSMSLETASEVEAPASEQDSDVAIVVGRAIGDLPKPQRDVVVRRLFEGDSFAAIAAELKTTEAACKMRFGRAVTEVRKTLERAGVGLAVLLVGELEPLLALL